MLKPLLLPLLLAIFPVLFLYGNNVSKLLLSSLGKISLFYSSLALVVSVLFLIVFKGHATKAANTAFIFLIFFNTYGILYRFLIELDLFRVEHYTLLPFVLSLAAYSAWFVTKMNQNSFWNSAVLILAALIVFNMIQIVPAEIKKQQRITQSQATTTAATNVEGNGNYPDIYLIIFDELAGLNAMREYWDYQGVDDFVDFVQSKGFFVAEDSKSNSIITLHLMSELLNYKPYPVEAVNTDIYYDDVNHSRAVRYLESLGYTTVTFDETRYWYQTYTPMPADYAFFHDEAKNRAGWAVFFDEFGMLVAENTMLKAFEASYKPIATESPYFEPHRRYVFFTADKIGQLSDIPSPKFVYVHLMIPHNPFIFDANGDPLDPVFSQNWNYYLGQYQFTIRIMEQMINNILREADPQRLPIIIIQSDHGARNGLASWHPDAVILKDYPMEYANHILNIMLLPEFDTSQLPQDLKPINTFPIIFNHYFGTEIPLIK